MNGEFDRAFRTVLQVRIGDRGLRSLPHRQAEARRADAPLHARAVDVREELRALRLGRLRRAGEAVTAAEQRAGRGLAAGDVREREPAEEARDLVVRRQRLHHARVPVTLQLHCDLAVREQAGRARRHLLRGCCQEAVLEGLRVEELLHVGARLEPARVLEVVRDRRLLHRRLAAELRGEIVPVEGVRPAVLASDRDRRDVRRLQLVDRGDELRPGRRCRRDPGLLEEVFVVPEPDDADAVRDGVLLAVHLPAGGRPADGLDPRLDVLGDVRDLVRLHLVDQRAAAPFLEDVGRVVRRERDRDLRLLQHVRLESGRLDRDVRMSGVVLLRDVVPELQPGPLVGVVPPDERHGLACLCLAPVAASELVTSTATLATTTPATASGFQRLMKSIPPSTGLAGHASTGCPRLLAASSRRESDRLENVLSTVFENDCEMV